MRPSSSLLRDEETDCDLVGRSAHERTKALDAIRSFRNDDALTLTYRSTAPNPYKDDDAQRIELYADDRGFEYWVDPADEILVQAGPSTGVHPQARKTGPEDRLTVSELRNRAVGIVAVQIPGWAARRSSLHPLEDNRNREVYFFRWDDFSQPAKESELPPFVQVGLYADGALASFTDTLARQGA
jgi:hypothetical protein